MLRRAVLAAVAAVALAAQAIPATARAQPVAPSADRGLGTLTIDLYPRPDESDDLYWQWLPVYDQARAGWQQRVDEIRIELAIVAAEVERLRGRWLELLLLDMSMMPEARESAALPGILDHLFGRIPDLVEELLSGDSPAAVVAAGAQTIVSLREERDRLRTRMNDLRASQQALIDEVAAGGERLLRLLDEQRRRSGERRPQLAEEASRIAGGMRFVRLALLDAARWYEHPQLPELVRAIEADGTDPVLAGMIRAQMALAEAERLKRGLAFQAAAPRPVDAAGADAQQARIRARQFEAIGHLRGVLALVAYPQAEAMLQEIELELLRLIQLKLDRERQLTLADFSTYLASRGYRTDRYDDWWTGAWEAFSVFWGSGPVTLVAQLPGADVPAAQAELASLAQEQVAANQVALLAVRKLRRNGIPLIRIREATPQMLADGMALTTLGSRTLAPERARALARDIRETFIELGDLKALADGDGAAFDLFYDAAYYQRLDAEQPWSEWFTDLFSPRHLVTLFGPFAVVRLQPAAGLPAAAGVSPAAPRWAAGFMGMNELRAAEQAGRVLRTRELVSGLVGFDRIGARFAASRAGAQLVTAMARDRALLESLPRWRQVLNSGGRLAAAIVLAGGAPQAARNVGGPPLQFVAEAVLELNAVDVAWDLLSRGGVPLGRLASGMADLEQALLRQRGQVVGRGTRIARLEELETTLRSGGVTVRREVGEQARSLRATLESAPRNVPLDGDEAVDHAVSLALDALAQGNAAEAGRALTAARHAQRQTIRRLDESAERLARAQAALRAAEAAGAASSYVPGPLPASRALDNLDPWTEFLPRPPAIGGTTGILLDRADAALKRGDYMDAMRGYRAAREAERAAGAADDTLRLIDDRLALAGNAHAVSLQRDAVQRTAAPLPAQAEITESAGIAVLDAIAGDRATRVPGSLNEVYRLPDLGLFAKVVASEEEGAAEVAASMLGRALGLPVPAARFAAGIDATGYRRLVVVTRAVEGAEQLAAKGLDTALGMRAEYARARAFRAWLGEADGHLGNQLLGADGRLWQIDFGLCSFNGTRFRQAGDLLEFGSQAELMHAALGFPRGSAGVPAYRAVDGRGRQFYDRWLDSVNDNSRYPWMARMDETIGYDQMADVVDGIRRLAADRNGLLTTLRAAGIGQPEAVADILVERAAVLADVLRTRFGSAAASAVLIPLPMRRRPQPAAPVPQPLPEAA